jgi:hypothetical protein
VARELDDKRRAAVDRELHRVARAVLARVRQALLDRAVGGPAHEVGNGRSLRFVIHGQARLAGFLEQRRELVERRLRRLDRARLLLAQQADDLAQLLERRARAGADDPGRLDVLGRDAVARVLERAGVHAEDREPVREHVVHLARDPPPLGLARLLLPALAQALEQLPLRAHEQAPPERHRGQQQPDGQLPAVAAPVHLGVQQREDRGARDRQRGDGGQCLQRHPDRGVEDRRQRGHRRQRRDGRQRDDQQRHGQRVRAAPEQRGARDAAERDVEHLDGVAVRVPGRAQHEHARAHRDDDDRDVHDPVAHGPRVVGALEQPA